MDITIPDELAVLAKSRHVDPETVALTAITEAIERAAIAASNEDENVRRREALEAVAVELEPAKEMIRTRERVRIEAEVVSLPEAEVAPAVEEPVVEKPVLEPVKLTRG